jgi:hypothetical protein
VSREYEDLPPDMDDRWKSEAWLYAATFSYGLRGRSFNPGDEPRLHPSATRIIAAILVANKPSLNSMLDELLTTNTGLMVRPQFIITNFDLIRIADGRSLDRRHCSIFKTKQARKSKVLRCAHGLSTIRCLRMDR